ncbi:hypothetical protein BKA62DRAFT_786517 [Auriculariales sp. MPI-PUGE-AT-0066]|nr:hypothetical protein BKA62DRAFT_786517 [Auriculariales sp. MPI-PUGE-AT-0066]
MSETFFGAAVHFRNPDNWDTTHGYNHPHAVSKYVHRVDLHFHPSFPLVLLKVEDIAEWLCLVCHASFIDVVGSPVVRPVPTMSFPEFTHLQSLSIRSLHQAFIFCILKIRHELGEGQVLGLVIPPAVQHPESAEFEYGRGISAGGGRADQLNHIEHLRLHCPFFQSTRQYNVLKEAVRIIRPCGRVRHLELEGYDSVFVSMILSSISQPLQSLAIITGQPVEPGILTGSPCTRTLRVFPLRLAGTRRCEEHTVTLGAESGSLITSTHWTHGIIAVAATLRGSADAFIEEPMNHGLPAKGTHRLRTLVTPGVPPDYSQFVVFANVTNCDVTR